MFSKYESAGNIHKKVYEKICNYELIDKSTKDISKFIENSIKDLSSNNEINGGIAFPIGISINDCCAHDTYSPHLKNNKIIRKNDLVKIDYGVHIDGYIVDGAYSFSNNDNKQNETLCNASKDALENALKIFRVDTRLDEVGKTIQEVIESYEYENKKCVPVFDLSGHKIDKFKIHSGKAVPNIKINYPLKIEEDEVYAIEPFVTYTKGNIYNKYKDTTHFMLNKLIKDDLVKKSYMDFNMLPFCDKWTEQKYDKLDECQYISKYPPLYTVNREKVAQFEKTVYVKEKSTIILN